MRPKPAVRSTTADLAAFSSLALDVWRSGSRPAMCCADSTGGSCCWIGCGEEPRR